MKFIWSETRRSWANHRCFDLGERSEGDFGLNQGKGNGYTVVLGIASVRRVVNEFVARAVSAGVACPISNVSQCVSY